MPVQKVQERWYEKLHEWDKALAAYERQQEKSPDDSAFLLGRMRCLEALGEWYPLFLIFTPFFPERCAVIFSFRTKFC